MALTVRTTVRGPSTVLPSISKILEGALHGQLYGSLSKSKLLTQIQFGFRPKLSTVTALGHFTDSIQESLDHSRMTGVIFQRSRKRLSTPLIMGIL